MTDPARPLVIGVGNRDRGDDAIGPVVADAVAERWRGRVDTAVVEGDLSTLPLLWSADQHVVVVDAMVLAATSTEPGTVVVFDGLGRRWPVAGDGAALSTHSIGLATAIELARRLDRPPNSLTVVAVAVSGRPFDHGAPMSAPLGRAVATIVDRVGAILNLDGRSPTLEAQRTPPQGEQ